MCLKSMIDKNDVGTDTSEHIEFYSLKSLKYLFENNGLEIFKIDENDINGGSYRIYCRKYTKGSIKLKNENELKMMKNFVKRVKINKKKIINISTYKKRKIRKFFYTEHQQKVIRCFNIMVLIKKILNTLQKEVLKNGENTQ